jgi:hypothetical protein
MYNDQGQPINGIAPASYTPPSHTEIAKDHGDMTGPVPDQISDNENHEHADGGAHSEGNEPPGHEHAPGEDEHGHVHISAWLNPIAETMAGRATESIGAKVASIWDLVDGAQPVADGDLNTIDTEVDRWFRHPADCKELWQPVVTPMLASQRFGPELLRQLAERRAQTPKTPGGGSD